MIRRSLITAAVIMAALIFCACAYADAAVYIGSRNAGAVKTIVKDSGLFVSVEDLGALMGFSHSRVGEELWLQRDNIQIRVIDNSAAAWYGFSIVPLYAAPLKQDGKTWLDSASAASLFQRVVGTGQERRLRINKISGYAASRTLGSDVELGDFEIPEPTPSIPTVSPAPAPSTTVARQVEIPKLIVPEVKTAAPAQPKEVEVKDTENETQEITPEPQPQMPAPEPETPKDVPEPPKPKPKTQPKLETFKLDDSKDDKAETYSGVIQGVRWTSHEGAQKKIRAVVLVDDEAEPSVFMNRKELHALFSSSLEAFKDLASPFENVKTEFKKNARGIDLSFSVEELTKAEKIVLNNPKRIVFDFFLPSEVTIINRTSADPQPQPPQIQSTTAVSKPEAPASIAEGEKQSEAPAKTLVLTPNTYQPQRNLKASGRKTIVVDAGHGGKDPGTSHNGAIEKIINLAIGLELEKALSDRGYNVIMTRRTDVYLKLQERTDIANDVNADLFVSIHVNALPSKPDTSGIEIYLMALPTDKDAMNLAKIENREYVEGKGLDTENVDRRTEMLLRILGDMQQNNKISESTEFAAALYNAGVRNNLPMRRVAQAPFFVLRGAGMPAVLIETGFVTNANESQLLTTSAYQQRIAQAMAEGIINYVK